MFVFILISEWHLKKVETSWDALHGIDQFLLIYVKCYFFLFIPTYNTRETWYLMCFESIFGKNWWLSMFRIDSLILDILEFWSCLSSYRNVTKKRCSNICILLWAIISWLKNEVYYIRNNLMSIHIQQIIGKCDTISKLF